MYRRCWNGWGSDMARMILIDPLIPLVMIAGLAAMLAVVLAIALWRGQSGWALRGLAATVLLAVLINPSLQQEEREPLNDIVLLAIDRTASQNIGGRNQQTEEAANHIRRAIANRGRTDLREISIYDSVDDLSGQ